MVVVVALALECTIAVGFLEAADVPAGLLYRAYTFRDEESRYSRRLVIKYWTLFFGGVSSSA